LLEENALFPGDCVMGWSTSVVSPPDGDMGEYRQDPGSALRQAVPGHRPPIRDVDALLHAYIAHRRRREREILGALRAFGPSTVRGLVQRVYADLDRRQRPATAHSVLAHLLDLHRRGIIDLDGPLGMAGVWRAPRCARPPDAARPARRNHTLSA